ncbi:MAG TPA: glutamate--tRNA ligase, partial [Cyclobacteriaceae bacterium]|nr:glutamate--tRNA ligase [Cyclobacteriaceae bacterium]
PHAPYRQSERKSIYRSEAQKLLDQGDAYYAFDTEEELETMRKSSPNAQYDASTRMKMRNSLTLSKEEVNKKLSSGEKFVIRLKVPEKQEIHLDDLIRGHVVFDSSIVDDKVLMKSDGMPTYHLANVVDDHYMDISHVIRGEEWLPSAPLHLLLYKFFGWENTMPQFAHLPLLLKPDGNGKLSKRDADKAGFPIFPLNWTDPKTGELAKGFRENGYLPEAMVNFLAFLGWNPGTEQEIFSMEQLIEAFTIERIGKAGARFDIQKAQWFNQQYLRAKSDDELATYLGRSLDEQKIECSADKVKKIVAIMKERVTFPNDFWEQGKFFFVAPASFDMQLVAKKWNDDTVKVLSAYRDALKGIEDVTAEKAKNTLEQVTASLGIKTGQILQMLRMVVTGGASGPDLMVTIEILGANEVVNRIGYALNTLKVKV